MTIRGFEEFEVMFGRKPIECVLEAGVEGRALAADFADALDREFEKAIIHFGEGRLNPSTIACVIAEAEKKLADRADRRCLLGNSPQQAATSDQLQPDVLPQPSHR